MTDPPGERPDDESATQVDASEAPFTRSVFVVLVVAAIVIPPLGMLVGAFNMDKPSRRRQSQILLAIGVAIIVLVVLSRT
jgi:hypothetical protein